jgi:3-oxoacyl-[acyl-carrier protein] reductase
MNISLLHQNALVCGATQGIGKATAQILAKAGANVTILARHLDTLQSTLDTLDVSQGQQHHFILADTQYPELLAKRVNDHLKIQKTTEWHILVNNSGGPNSGKIKDATAMQFTQAFNAHLLANHTLAQIFIPLMQNAGFGRIINVISTSVREPLPNLGVSNTTRWAVASWAKTLATELAPLNITVNNVLPGATETQRITQIITQKASQNQKSEDETKHEMQAEIPMKRFAQPEEIANGILFLASPLASYITGINLPIDGGRMKTI